MGCKHSKHVLASVRKRPISTKMSRSCADNHSIQTKVNQTNSIRSSALHNLSRENVYTQEDADNNNVNNNEMLSIISSTKSSMHNTNYALKFGGDTLDLIASFVTKEKILPDIRWRRHKEYHNLCLKQRDRPWAEDCDRRVGHPMNLVIYDSIHHSIEEIIAHVTRPPFDFIKSDVTKELYKLYNGGWISDTQLSVVQSRLGIEAERPSTEAIISRKKKSKKMKSKKPQHKLERKLMNRESQETPSLPIIIKRMVKEVLAFGSTQVPRVEKTPRKKSKKRKKRHCKNRRRKKAIQDYQLINYNKNKGKRNQRKMRTQKYKSSMEDFVLMIALPIMVLMWFLPTFTASERVVIYQHGRDLLQPKKSPEKSPKKRRKKREFHISWARATYVCGRRMRRKRRQYGRRMTYKEVARDAVRQAKRDYLEAKRKHLITQRFMKELNTRLEEMKDDVDTEVDTLPCTSSSSDLDDLSDGIPFGPYPSPLFYDEENTKSATDTDGGEY